MSTKDLLKLGRLTNGASSGFKVFSGGTPGSGGETGFIRVEAAFTNGSTDVTVNSDKVGYYPRTYIRVGQLCRITGVGFTNNQTIITSVGAGGNSFTIEDTPTTDKTGTTVIKPGKTQIFVASGSFVRPTGYPVWNLTKVTGSDDSNYSSDDRKWAIYTQLALTSSYTTNVDSVYGIYEISEVTNRISNNLISFFATASDDYPEPKAFTAYSTGASIGISELTLTGSVAPLFHGGDIGVLEGLGFAAAQDQALTFLSQTGSEGSSAGFPFTGSAQITGSLSITGSSTFELNQGQTTDFFLIKSSSFNPLKVNSDGVVTFGGFNNLPTAVEGGVAYSGSNFYVGLE